MRVVRAVEARQHPEPNRDVEKAETHHRETHDGTRTERDPKSVVQRMACSVRSACGCVRRGPHADEARKTGEDSAGKERERHPRVLHLEDVSDDAEHARQGDEDRADDLVLLLEIRDCAGTDVRRDRRHRFCALGFLHHLAEESVSGTERNN